MKIERIHIYGFGKWIDETFDFSNRTLTCLYGENEAGKSTLQQFIMYMLFGLPPKQRKFYQPKQSNRVGGSLTMTDEEYGTFTIERIEDEVQCYLPSGEKRDEKFLQDRLNGLTKEIYTSVYSFSALDLNSIRKMKGKELSDVLFSVGLTGATAIYRVEKQLEKELGELFKKSGRKPLINQQMSKVSELYETLQKDHALEKSYREKIERKEDLQIELEDLENTIRSLKEKLFKLEKVKQLCPLIKEYELIEKKLTNYPTVIPFPEDGVTRYDSLKQQLLPLKSELHLLHKTEKEYEAKIEELLSKLYTEEQMEQGEELLKQYRHHQVRKEKISALENDLFHINETIRELLQSVPLSENEVEAIHLPFHLEKNWTALSETNDKLLVESEKITDDHQVLNEELNRLQKEEVKITDELLPEKEITRMEEQVDRFAIAQAEKKQKEQLIAWHKKRKKMHRNAFVSTSVLAMISFFAAIFLENNILWTIPALFVLIATGQMYMLKTTTDEMNQINVNETSHMTEEEKKQLELRLQRQRELKAELQVINSERKRLNLQQLQLEERKRIFAQHESKWMEQIREEQRNYPFLKHIEPAYWVELLELLRKLKGMIGEKRQITSQIQSLKEENKLFYHSLHRFSSSLQSDQPLSMTEIETLLEQQRSYEQMISEYRELVGKNRKNERQLREKIAVYEAEISQLFDIAQVMDEEQYFQRAKQLTEKNRLMEQKETLLQQLYMSVSEAELERLLQESFDEADITIEIEQLAEQMEEFENEKENKTKQLAQLQLEITQLEMSEDVSKTAYLYEMEKDKLNRLAKKWAILKCAQAALSDAKKSYQQKYLHEVIELTTKYFSKLTKGTYQKVFAPTESELFQVEAVNDMRYTVEELSKGTIDQLYISLRLAISKVMSDKFIVPMIIDDAFVHFDDTRTKEMIHILKEIAKERQVLLFTCKEQIARQFDHTELQKLQEVV